MIAHDSRPERHEGQLGDLEVLLSPRYADNSDAEDHTNERVGDRHLDPAEDDPQDIQKERDRAAVFIHDLLAKRIQGNARKLEALQTDRDPDDRYAP